MSQQSLYRTSLYLVNGLNTLILIHWRRLPTWNYHTAQEDLTPVQPDATGNVSEIQQCTLAYRRTTQLRLVTPEQAVLLVPFNAVVIHACSRRYFAQREGLQQQHFIYSSVQRKLFSFSTMAAAQGTFQAWPQQLTSWQPQKQLAGPKAAPGRRSLGTFSARVTPAQRAGPRAPAGRQPRRGPPPPRAARGPDFQARLPAR